jgi:hypothetical protein
LQQAKYVRAADINGATWQFPYAITPYAIGDISISLKVIDNYPVVAFSRLATGQVFYARAVDPVGSSFYSQALISSDLSPIPSYTLRVEQFNGKMIVFYINNLGDVVAVRSADTWGNVFEPEEAIVAATDFSVMPLVDDDTVFGVGYYNGTLSYITYSNDLQTATYNINWIAVGA